MEQFKLEPFQICLIDVMMPVMDGYTLIENIRLIDAHIPLLLLTAKGLKEDKIQGFRSGADDYIVKPFSMEELLLRMNVFLNRNRKSNPETKQSVLKIGQVFL